MKKSYVTLVTLRYVYSFIELCRTNEEGVDYTVSITRGFYRNSLVIYVQYSAFYRIEKYSFSDVNEHLRFYEDLLHDFVQQGYEIV